MLTCSLDLPLRNDVEQRRLGKEWKNEETNAERSAHFKNHGVRYTEFARLPYFDISRMMIIDPMHNLLLGMSILYGVGTLLTSPIGIVKNQWYTRWIKCNALRADTDGGKKRELAILHDFLDTVSSRTFHIVYYAINHRYFLNRHYFMKFEAPQWTGRLPLRVGEPAGGSLSADEYKLLMTGPGPLVVGPVVFHVRIA